MSDKRFRQQGREFKRVHYSVPPSVVELIERYAGKVRGGNKSGFVADAIEAYVGQLTKNRRTAALRRAYQKSKGDSEAIGRRWSGVPASAATDTTIDRGDIQRGHVVDVRLPDGSVSPAVVVSNDILNELGGAIVVVPLWESRANSAAWPKVTLRTNGRRTAIAAVPEQVRAIAPGQLVGQSGRVDDADLVEIEQSLHTVLDLSDHSSR